MKKLIMLLPIIFIGSSFQIYAPEIFEPVSSDAFLTKINNQTKSPSRSLEAFVHDGGLTENGDQIAHLVNDSGSHIASVNKTTGAIISIATNAKPEDIVATLSDTLSTTTTNLNPLEKSALTKAIAKAQNKSDYSDFNLQLSHILHKRNTSLDEHQLLNILQKSEALKGSWQSTFNSINSMISHGITALTPNKISPIDTSLPSIKLSDQATKLLQNTQPSRSASPKATGMSTDQTNTSTRILDLGFQPTPKTKITFGAPERSRLSISETALPTNNAQPRTAQTPNRQMPKGLQIDANTGMAKLVGKTGTVKATIDLSSTTSGLIRSISSSANPLNIAQSISDVLVEASKKSGNPVQPFSSDEVASLGSYIKQMNEGGSLSSKVTNSLFTKAGLGLSKTDVNEITSDNFNAYLGKLLEARSTHLSQAQLVDAIEQAESAPKGIFIDATNAYHLGAASTPEHENPGMGAITLSTPISVLPEGVTRVSQDLSDFTEFSRSLKSALDSMQPADAKALLKNVLGKLESPFGGQSILNSDASVDQELTNIDFLTGELSDNAALKNLHTQTIDQINALLEKISSDPYNPIKLTDKNYTQIKNGLVPLLRDVCKPILGEAPDTETHSVLDVPTRLLQNALEAYPGKIKQLLSKKLGSNTQSLASASKAIADQFTRGVETFSQYNYPENINPAKDTAIKNMTVLLAPTLAGPATEQEAMDHMQFLKLFLDQPKFDEDYEPVVNTLLKNMNSDIRLTEKNYTDIARYLEPLKGVLKIALGEKSLYTKVKIAGSLEKSASVFIQNALKQTEGRTFISDSLPKAQQEAIRLTDTAKIISKELQTKKGSTPFIQKTSSENNAVASMNLLLTDGNVGIYDLSNPNAKAKLISDIQALQTFLESPTPSLNSQTTEIINNIISNLQSKAGFSSPSTIQTCLLPLKPILKIALDGLGANQLPKESITENKPAMIPSDFQTERDRVINMFTGKPLAPEISDPAQLKQASEAAASGAIYAANSAKNIVSDPDFGLQSVIDAARAAGKGDIADAANLAAQKALAAADNAIQAAAQVRSNPTQANIDAAQEAIKEARAATSAASKARDLADNATPQT